MSANDLPRNQIQAELARRTLKALAERRLIPTPDTFAEVYFEIAGVKPGQGSAVGVVQELLRDLVRANRISGAEQATLNEQAARHDWPAVREALDKMLERRNGAAAANWPRMTLSLIKLLDALHPKWTRGRKLDAVSRVLEGNAAEPELAFERVQRLIDSWGPALAVLPRGQRDEAREPSSSGAQPLPADLVGMMPAAQRYAADPDEFRVLQASREAAQAQADAWKHVAMRATRLIDARCAEGSAGQVKLREFVAQYGLTQPVEATDKLLPRFIDVVAAIEPELGESEQIKAGLKRLLSLLCDNIHSLSPEEAWLAGQLEPIRALLAGPMQTAQLAEAESKLAQIITEQAGARRSLQEAKSAFKEMLPALIDRIGTVGDSTGRFFEKVNAYQGELDGAQDFETLSRVIKGLRADTQAVSTDIQKSRDDLLQTRRKVEAYEQRVKQLEKELTTLSSLVQKDPLTHALNRRGLEETFRVETARSLRYGTPLSIALVDLDNFKRLNDTLGHLAGDRALVHLLTVMQGALRGTDAITRIGGEEFAILFSSTAAEEAAASTRRLQSELAGRPFEHEGCRQVLTFSAGVTGWVPGDSLEAVLRRADDLMYRAKRAGKNRVEKDG